VEMSRQVEQVERQVREHGLAYLTMPPKALASCVVAEYVNAYALARKAGEAEGVQRLWRGMARLAGLMVMLFNEAECPHRASSWLAAADEAAEVVDDPGLECWLRALAARTACERGRYTEAAIIAGKARDIAPETVGAVLAQAVRTVAWAELGRSSEALASLKHTDEAYARLGPGDTAASMFGYPRGLRHHHRGQVFATLGMAPAGRLALQAALRCYPAEALRARTEVALDLARCGGQAALREAKAALERLPAAHRTARLARRLEER
jgi:tetratricopeptide (TPR) repeat protein